MILCLQLLQMLEKYSQMENFLTQQDTMPPALTCRRNTQEKSSQMENFLTQYDSMPLALTNARKILTNGKYPHPA